MCWNNCGLLVRKVNDVVVNIEGDPENPHTKGMICAKGLAAPMNLYSPHRVKTPLKRTNPEKGIGVDPKWTCGSVTPGRRYPSLASITFVASKIADGEDIATILPSSIETVPLKTP